MYRSRVSSARRRDSSNCSFSRRRRSSSAATSSRFMVRRLPDDQEDHAFTPPSRLDPPGVDQKRLSPDAAKACSTAYPSKFCRSGSTSSSKRRSPGMFQAFRPARRCTGLGLPLQHGTSPRRPGSPAHPQVGGQQQDRIAHRRHQRVARRRAPPRAPPPGPRRGHVDEHDDRAVDPVVDGLVGTDLQRERLPSWLLDLALRRLTVRSTRVISDSRSGHGSWA